MVTTTNQNGLDTHKNTLFNFSNNNNKLFSHSLHCL